MFLIFVDTQQRKCTYSSGSEKNNSKSEFLCYPLQLQSKRRISFTKKQVEVFESLFEKTIYPDGPQLQEVAEKTGVSKARLKVSSTLQRTFVSLASV